MGTDNDVKAMDKAWRRWYGLLVREGVRWKRERPRWMGGMFFMGMLLVALLLGIFLKFSSMQRSRFEWGSVRCTNLLIDVGVESGEGIMEFRNTGGSLKEFLDRQGLFPAAFCVDAFEVQRRYTEQLKLAGDIVRKDLEGVWCHPETVLANFEGHAHVQVEGIFMNTAPVMQVVDDKHVVYNLRSKHRGKQRLEILPVVDMWNVISKRRLLPRGLVVLRASVSPTDGALYLRTVLSDARLCSSIDHIVLELRDKENSLIANELDSTLSPTSLIEIELLVKLFTTTGGCKARVELQLPETIPDLSPARNSKVFYAILAGAPTFIERVGAAASSWLRSVPKGEVAIFTNKMINVTDGILDKVRGHVTVVTPPSQPKTEKTLYTMQSWSHLVRLRTAWDLFMSKDPDLSYLALVDDDTFVFTDTLKAVLESCMDPEKLQWGGSNEYVRIDNEDGGVYGKQLRENHIKGGGKPCYFDSEPAVPGQKKCKDTMCSKCPSIPQGGAVFLTRAIVEKLRPFVEECEKETQVLCMRCGSQRLYFCIHSKLKSVETKAIRGVFRHVWRSEKQSKSTNHHGYPVSLHGVRENLDKLHTGYLQSDFGEMYDLVQQARRRGAVNGGDPFVTKEDLNDQILCDGKGHYRDGECYAKLQDTYGWCNQKVYIWSYER